MKVIDGRETLYESAYLLDRGYGKIVFTGNILLSGGTEDMLKVHSMLRDKFKVISVVGCYEKDNWDIALHEEIPSWVTLNNKSGDDNTLILKNKVVKFLQQIDIDNVSASVSNHLEFFDYKSVCTDAKRYFDKIVGEKTTLAEKKGKFISCNKCDDKSSKDYEHEYTFELDEKINNNKYIITRDILMLSNGIKNGDV